MWHCERCRAKRRSERGPNWDGTIIKSAAVPVRKQE